MSVQARQLTQEVFPFLLSYVSSLHFLHLAHVHTIQLYLELTSNSVCTFGAVINANVAERTFKCAESCFSSLSGWGAAAQLFFTLASRQRVRLQKAGLQLGETDLLPFSALQGTASATALHQLQHSDPSKTRVRLTQETKF